MHQLMLHIECPLADVPVTQAQALHIEVITQLSSVSHMSSHSSALSENRKNRYIFILANLFSYLYTDTLCPILCCVADIW